MTLNSNKVVEIAGLFIKLGLVAFGGPAAHIALMQKEVIEKRRWMSDQHYLDLIGITSLIPGPNSTEMVMHCGKERGGVAGLFMAGASFILPAVVITLGVAYLYTVYGKLPAVEPWIYGIKIGVIALIVSAVIKLAKKAVKNWMLGVIGALAVVTGLFGIHEILIILGAGLLYLGLKQFKFIPSVIVPLTLLGPVAANRTETMTSLKIFLVFLKLSLVQLNRFLNSSLPNCSSTIFPMIRPVLHFQNRSCPNHRNNLITLHFHSDFHNLHFHGNLSRPTISFNSRASFLPCMLATAVGFCDWG